MKRTFKLFSIVAGGTPQPLVGTQVAGAATIITDPGSSRGSQQTVQVGDSSMFNPGDDVVFDVKANGEERTRVDAIVDATHIKVSGLTKAHAIGAYIRLSTLCQSLYVQTKKVNAASIFIGTQGLVKGTYANVIVELLQVGAGVQPIDWTDPMSVGGNGVDVGDYWIDGTTADGYLPSFSVL